MSSACTPILVGVVSPLSEILLIEIYFQKHDAQFIVELGNEPKTTCLLMCCNQNGAYNN